MTTTSAIDHLRAEHLGNRFPTFTMVGGYPIFYLAQDNEVICPACVNGENGSEVGNSEYDGDPQWTIVASDVNWEDPEMFCCHCNERIESAYAEDTD